MLNVSLSSVHNYLYYIDKIFPFVKLRSWQLRSCRKTSIAVKTYSRVGWLTLETNSCAIFCQNRTETVFGFFGRDEGGARERERIYTRKLPWARNEICQEMRFSARAVMYAARINGGSVENEFSEVANNKARREREREKKGRQSPVHSAEIFSSKFLNFRRRMTRYS